MVRTALRVRSLGASGIVGLFACALAHAGSPPVTDRGLLPGDLGIAPAVNSQLEHAAARGGEQTLVVWTDYRARSNGSQTIQSDGDIFGIRLDSAGNPIDAAPFLIAGGMGLQQRPRLAWNGEAWLVLYVSQDPVAGYYADQLRAVRVSASGQILDATPLLLPPTQFSPDSIGLQLAGAGGQWLITRCVYHGDGYGTFLAGHRVNGAGQLLDAAPVMLIDWVYGQTVSLAANGEYLVAGPDWTNSSTIKARRINASAQPVGAAFNIPSMTIASSGSEYYVAWIANFVNLVGSRMTSSGTLLTPSGTVLVQDFSQYHQSTLAHDGVNWWLEWGAADQLHTVRISGAGAVLDPGGGPLLPIVIGGTVNNAYSPVLLPRAGGGVNLFWYDSRPTLGSDTNIFRLPIGADNTPGVEQCVSTGTRSERSPDFAEGPGGSSAVVFVSEAAGDDRILVHTLDASGAAESPEPIEVHRAATIGRAGIAFNGSIYMVAWDEGASGLTPTQVRMRRMNPDGSFIDPAPVNVLTGFNPDVGALGDDFLVVGARYGSTAQFIDLYGRRIDGPTASFLDASPILLAFGYVSGQSRVRSDGTQWLVASHSQWSHDSSQGDALLARVPPAGPPVAAGNPTPVSGGSGDLDIAFSGSKYLLVWRSNSLSNANNYIAGRIMNADGSFPGASFTIAEAAGRQLRPTVAWDGTAFLVAWDDQRNQSSFFDAQTDIYAARVTETGALLDAAAFPVAAGPQGDCGAAVIARGGLTLVASARFTVAPGSGFDSWRVGISALGAPPCPQDFNGAGGITVQDIYDFLSAWSAGLPQADFNGAGGITVQDIYDFLSAWSAGCN